MSERIVSQARVEFTKDMKRTHTILVPDMAAIHFAILENVLNGDGYRVEVLRSGGPAVVEQGLKYVHNDTCYPALVVIGQFLDALLSGRYDPARTALLLTQTGGGCRASNYIQLLRKALEKAGFAQVPVIALSAAGLEKNSGFSMTPRLLLKAVAALAYGDLLMLLYNQVRPYENNPGESAAAVDSAVTALSNELCQNSGYTRRAMKRNFTRIAASFAKIDKTAAPKVKVGVVGEIYVKYSPIGNNGLEEFLLGAGCEVMVPGLLPFIMYNTQDAVTNAALYGGGALSSAISRLINGYLGGIERALIAAAAAQGFAAPTGFAHLMRLGEKVMGLGCVMGEGWLLPAEIMELVELGYENVVCAQPFGCLPNHVIAKGLTAKIKAVHETANIVPVDYDPGATRVNQENRIMLMLSVARERLSDGGAAAVDVAAVGAAAD
jgi:predicted nucleotide-binding protein (sugar kinase/HSP70/actin superfamily)